MSEPTIEQHLTAVRESLAEALGENGCIVEIVPTHSPRVTQMDICASNKTPETQPAPKNQTMAKLRCRRFMDGDTKMIEMLEISGVSSAIQLPDEYTRHVPHFQLCRYQNDEYISIVMAHCLSCSLCVGDKITYKRYGKLMRIMKEAGQRLTDINTRRKKEQEFSGEFEVTI